MQLWPFGRRNTDATQRARINVSAPLALVFFFFQFFPTLFFLCVDLLQPVDSNTSLDGDEPPSTPPGPSTRTPFPFLQSPSFSTTNTSPTSASSLPRSGVRVFCRIRPPSDNNGHLPLCVTPSRINPCAVQSKRMDAVDSPTRNYTFERVFTANASQQDVHETTCEDIVDGFFTGINAAVIACGQTGSGGFVYVQSFCVFIPKIQFARAIQHWQEKPIQ
jgi:hypothetical protein